MLNILSTPTYILPPQGGGKKEEYHFPSRGRRKGKVSTAQ